MSETDVRGEEGYNPNQHCTNPDCMTFSHTAKYCGEPQPRRCPCTFDYPVGAEAVVQDLEAKQHTEGSLWAYTRLVEEAELTGDTAVSIEYIKARADVERAELKRITHG